MTTTPPRASIDSALVGQPAEVALPILLEEHGGRLYHLALELCGHAEDAEDLVQEIFLIALRKWHQFKGESKPTTWLYTIAARACSRGRRKRAGEPMHLESLSELLPGGEEPVPDPTVLGNPLDEHLRREAREAVERAIAGLPEHFRMPLVLKEIVELPITEVAAILGLKEATVKTRVHRGRLLLGRELSKVLPKTDAPPTPLSRQMCLDLLEAKQASLDRNLPFTVPQAVICSRCESMFATLDLGHEVCEVLGRGEVPANLRDTLVEAFAEADSSA